MKTGKDGQYTIGLLHPEIYTIQITAEGFKAEKPPVVTILVTETARADAKMVPGNAGETVEVTSLAPALQVKRNAEDGCRGLDHSRDAPKQS